MQAGEEDRLLVWPAREDEQALVSGTMLSGELRGDDGRGAPVVGVYLNDLSEAKIAYYQRMEVEVEARQCVGGRCRTVDWAGSRCRPGGYGRRPS